jgi:hypothetical protein
MITLFIYFIIALSTIGIIFDKTDIGELWFDDLSLEESHIVASYLCGVLFPITFILWVLYLPILIVKYRREK